MQTMLSQAQRATILDLHAKGMNKREIAKLLRLSRQSVRKVLAANEDRARGESHALPPTDSRAAAGVQGQCRASP